ncbi:hypothetical protein P5673_030459 [Acropora cervicornis]|uniref:Uncharacterized protein n=1 Tax=Acropora cervicornis TaxID=6130 RepID=A0AAD9PU27_ACRCE|nr:hypothetical protein P5673_030459 [Acropora cervicornis]
MDKLQPPIALALTGNLAENWRQFKQQFKIYEIASGLARKDGKVRAMTLLHVAGSEALELYNTFQWDEDDDNTKVEKIMEKNQLEGESIDAYVTDLRNKASRCEFAELKDGLIRDRSVCGVNSDTVRARLLRELELSLEMCIDICRAAEISSAHLKVLTEEKVPFFIGTIGSKQVGEKDWYVNFKINNCTIPFKIDTGAQCNVMPRSTCDEAGIVTSGSSRSKLVSYSGHEIKTIGKTDVVILYQDRYHVREMSCQLWV